MIRNFGSKLTVKVVIVLLIKNVQANSSAPYEAKDVNAHKQWGRHGDGTAICVNALACVGI